MGKRLEADQGEPGQQDEGQADAEQEARPEGAAWRGRACPVRCGPSPPGRDRLPAADT
ncbi:hypothetical protein OOJ91_20785 [Micromonospora lupini]|uniref:hypothetical protein n=1 Tax=Micromonospora lupini TaxID=285679 RepID=UPI0022573A84|nr:hypothetical protein [Micromonospora lupini]MCX5068279.1 hypothetical protein [Micromonospora lupini]